MSRRSFSIKPVPPFRLDLTAWALRRRPENAIDRWDGSIYQRVLMVDGQAMEVAVRQSGGPEAPQLEVDLTGPRLTMRHEGSARALLECMLGAHKDLQPFYKLASHDPRLRPLVDEFRGLKPPRFPTVFEAVANGIACQQLSLLVGILLLSRLASKIGILSRGSNDAEHAFPGPTDFSGVKVESLKLLGFSANKAQVLIDISSAIRDRRLNLESLAELDNQIAIERLVERATGPFCRATSPTARPGPPMTRHKTGERNARRQVAAENGQVGRSTRPTAGARCEQSDLKKRDAREPNKAQRSHRTDENVR